jgi:iron complex outermembrane receptor protein
MTADLRAGPWRIGPTFGVENLFDRRYVGAVTVNGANGRYYEPAAGRTFYGGMTVGAW